ncbi:MAG TPA: hypothetical protein VFN35_35535 [Ktedonobacteraceae bacterium]|nr:hypothetical protein [Ktedonobacteraceae bacterium]
MSMMPEAFHIWSQHLRFRCETEVFIASARSSPPIRQIGGRAGKLSGQPRATLLADTYSKHILTDDSPRSCSGMIVPWICVQRHQSFPQECFDFALVLPVSPQKFCCFRAICNLNA